MPPIRREGAIANAWAARLVFAALALAIFTVGNAPEARGATLMSIYPIALLPNLVEEPTGFKLYAGAGWRNLRWRGWGSPRAVARGTVFDHPGIPGGIKAKGTLIASGLKPCGSDFVYTRFRHRFSGRRAKHARYLKNSKYKVTQAEMECRSGDTNVVVHLPTVWAQLGPYPAADDMDPQETPSSLTLTNHAGLANLTWTSWGDPTATATGSASVDDFFDECQFGDRCTRTSSVTVTASELGHCGKYKTYRSFTVTESPSGWTGIYPGPYSLSGSGIFC